MDGGGRFRVVSVAIAASERARVLGVRRGPLLVTAGAVRRHDARSLMHVMAIGAVHRGVLLDGRRVPSRLGMAIATAHDRLRRREGVAGQTTGGVPPHAAPVRDRVLLRVAALADARAWIDEAIALVVVACRAIEVGLTDVGAVTRARAILGPRRGHELRRQAAGRPWPGPNDERNDRRERKEGSGGGPGRASRARVHGPTPWHARQGTSWCSSFRLEKPGPCGLPPGPPTRWQPTHSCSPAPPWHPAHEAGSRRAWGPWSPPPGASHPGGCGLRVVASGATPLRV